MIRKCSFFASPISSAAENKQFEFVLSLISLNVKSMQLMVKIKVVSLCVAFLYFSYETEHRKADRTVGVNCFVISNISSGTA